LVNGFGYIRETGHSLVGKGGLDDVSGRVLQGLLVAGLNPGAAVEIEVGMPPR